MQFNTKGVVMEAKYIVLLVIGGFFLLFLSLLITGMIAESDAFSFSSSTVALIHIDAPIVTEASNSLFSQALTSSSWVKDQIKQAEEDAFVEAIVFEINSPGGSAVASKEIVDAIKQTKKPTVSYIREVGASGAYWAASATDYVFADELSITGSIGVLGSYLSFSGLLENYNVSYERFVGGKYKDIGSPYKEVSEEERTIVQNKIDIIHEYFIQDVASNRKIEVETMRELASGVYYLGSEALELNLIDALGGEEETKQHLAKMLGLESAENLDFKTYEQRRGFLQSLQGLTQSISFSLGEGIATSLTRSEFKIFT
jgi:protease IV